MLADLGTLAGVRLDYTRASVARLDEVRAEDPDAVQSALLDVRGVSEAFYIATCNRVEAYVVADEAATARDALAKTDLGAAPASVEMDREECLSHLLAVAAGLESMVLGEDEILGQVADAYERARDSGTLGAVLDTVLPKAIRVGKRARTETDIGEGTSSLATAAVEYLATRTTLATAGALVVGTGRMGRLAADAFVDAGVTDLVVANRTSERAEELCRDLDYPARARDLDGIEPALDRADVCVVATGSDEPVLTADEAAGAGETLVVDLGQPADVAPEVHDRTDCEVAGLDDLHSVTESAFERHRDAVREVETLVDAELDALRSQLRQQRVNDVVADLYATGETVKEREVADAIARLERHGEVSEAERAVLEDFADALVSQLLANPTAALREAAADDDFERVRLIERLFSNTRVTDDDAASRSRSTPVPLLDD